MKHIDEAYAMEQNVLRMLDGMISTTDDPDIVRELEHHKIADRGARRADEGSASTRTVRSRRWCARSAGSSAR